MLICPKGTRESMKTCKDCSNFLGGGDWNLCCKNPPKDRVGWCGFLCYEDTEACENFNIWPDIGWVSCKDCIFSEDCSNKEDRDGCCLGEEEEDVSSN